jgi:hypothetical protein
VLRERKLLAEGHNEADCVAHWLALELTLSLLRVSVGEAEPVPRSPRAPAPSVALRLAVTLGLPVANLLTDTEGVAEAERETETVALPLEEILLLAEELRETESVAHWLAERLTVLLTLRVPEGRAEAVPRKPSAAAPPVALGLPVPYPLTDTEDVTEEDSEPEPEQLTVAVTLLLKEGLCDTERVGQWLVVALLAPELLRVLEVVAEAVPRKPSAAAPPVALGLSVTLPLKETESVGVMEPETEDVKLALDE